MALTQGAMDQIGRYKILGEVGRGAMGVVYRAQDPAIGRIVAIKMIRLGDLADPSEHAKLRDRLMREAQSAGILSHPGIVTIYDVGEQDGLAYISMEYVDGPTLERMVVNDPPDAKLVLEILSQTAAALDYAHKRGIVHRDIKPANIMIHERTIAKITDFGVARIQSSHQMTQAGSMIGTPNYMSPEQIQGQPVDGRSDQFSLAVIAYELLTGEKPFSADSIPSLAFKIVQEEPPQVHRLNPTLEWPVDTVLRRALSKNPADRYPTCSDFAFAIENACRASKKWKPVAAGALQNLPTLPGHARPWPASASKRTAAEPKVTPMAAGILNPPVNTSTGTPRLLRWARGLVLTIVSAALVLGAIFGALHFMENDKEDKSTVAPSTAKDETAVVIPPKPSAMPTEPASTAPTRPTEVPADAPGTVKEETQPADAPKTERAKPKLGLSVTRMVTNPPGVYLVVDGSSQYSCTTPCSMELPAGRHTIVATREGYRRTLKIFETPGSEDVFLNLDRMSGMLMVRSEPRGAEIMVDGQLRSEKTPAMLNLPTGRHNIEVQQANRKVTQEVVIRDSGITNLAVDLQ